MKNSYEELISTAQMAFISSQYEYALEVCGRVLLKNSDQKQALEIAGNSSFLLSQYTNSEIYFKRLVGLDSTNGEYYFGLGNSIFAQKRFSEALDCYARAEKLGCSDEAKKKIYYLMGALNQQFGNTADALSNYEKSENIPGINTDQVDILLKKIEIFVGQRDFESAELYAVQLKLFIPTVFKSYQLLFQIYLEQRKFSDAEAVLEEAKLQCKDSPEARVEIGFDYALFNCFLADSNPASQSVYYRKAIDVLDELKKIENLSEKDNAEAIITQAEIFLKMCQYQDAIALARESDKWKSSELIDYKERGIFILVQAYERMESYDFVQYYGARLKNCGNLFYKHHGYYAEAYATKMLSRKNPGLKQLCIDKYNMAIAYYRNITMASPSDFIAFLYRAKSYVDIGKYEKALEIAKMLPEQAKLSLEEYVDSVRKEKL